MGGEVRGKGEMVVGILGGVKVGAHTSSERVRGRKGRMHIYLIK